MNKVLNVITLIIMVSVNIMTPFSYAEFDDIVTESAAESTEQDDGGDTGDSLSEDSESEDNSEEDSEEDSEEISQTNDEEDSDDENSEEENEEENEEEENEEEGTEEESDIDENSEDENTQDSSTSSQNDEDSEDEEGQVGSGEDSSLQAPQNENNTQDFLSGASEGELGNGEISAEGENEEENYTEGEEGTGDVSAIEMVKDSIEGLSGIYLSGDVAELSGEVVELTGNDLELSIARETLNEDLIQKSEYYNGVSVNVEAQPGTFPQGTELRINPVIGTELNEVKDQVLDKDGSISEESLVAFDISFIYILSGGEEVELQPKNSDGVKVVFNYENNENLSEADNNDEQKVKVFHIDDKDKNGEKVAQGEEVVKDVTNRVESEEEGIAVAKAESFSIYAVVTVELDLEPIQVTYYLNDGHWTENGSTSPEIVTYTKSEGGDYIADKYFKTPSKDGYMFMGWFDQSGTTRWTGNLSENIEVYAKWQKFEDLDIYIINDGQSAHYTMMDRNLGATERFNQKYDQQNLGSVGYHFQWGNNYGFKPCNGKYNCSSFDEGENVSSGELDNIIRSNVSPSKFYYGVWNNNGYMRWSGNNVSNLWGSETNTLESRQGPCPEGYHIPNDNEWEEVINKSKNVGISVVNISVALLLSQPGYRNAGGKWINFPHTFWSSDASYSMDNKIKTSFILFESGQFGFEKDQGVDSGRSIRCFKNVVTNSFDISHINEDGGLRGEISISSGTVLYLKNPVKQGYIFDGWYKNSGFLGEKIELGSYISSTDYLYAKWSTCPSGFVADDESINCLPESIAYADDQKTSQIVENLEVFMINDNNETFHYTLMDRNMGAKERYDGNIENQNSYGYVYQWGNNYGFPSTGSLVDHGIASYNFQVPYSDWIIYSPSNFSKNVWNTFNSNNGKGAGWIDDAGLDDSKLLWQGDGTAESRQGPCPDGYYVPYKDIFQSFINQWKASDPKFSYKSFASDFLFPIVGYRKIDGTLQSGFGKYWMSTPYNSRGTANIFYLNTLSFEGEQNYDFGYSVRCFKKEANTGFNTFDISHIQLSGGSNVVLSMLSSGEIVGLTNPILEDHAFQGWYKDENFTPGTEVNVGDVLLTGDYLYAKWGECDEGEIQTSHGCQITAEGQKNQQIVSDLDVYILGSDSSKEHYTLMDRNMGAIDIYDKNYDSPNPGSLGYYYQWGNNYGFDTYLDNDGKLLYTDSTRVDVLSGSWDEPYDSYIFIRSRNWMNQAIPNKRGGEDTILSHRQGPCPDSYHIPGADEWSTVISGWNAARNSSKTEGFTNVFLLPPAGYRDRGSDDFKFSTVLNKGKFIRYTTSSWVDGVEPKNENNNKYRPVYAVVADQKTDLPKLTDTQYERTSNALSIRCFKNEVNAKTLAIDTDDIHLDGGENAIISILSSGEVINLQNPTRASSNFLGWYTISGDLVEVGSIVEPGSSLYAKFECKTAGYKWNGTACVEEFTITFNSNGGSAVEPKKVLKNLTGTKPDDPIRDGYEFRYWHLNGSSTEFDFENTVINSSITLVAEWTPIVYNINYFGIEGAIFESGNPSTYTIETNTFTLNNPIKEGFDFEGWSGTDIDGLSTNVVIPLGSTGDRVFEAVWGDGEYNLIFDSMGGTPVNSQKVPYNGTGIRPEDPTRDGFDFVNWYWTGMINEFDFTGTTITGDITVYAKWEDPMSELTGWDGCYQYKTYTGEVEETVQYYAEITAYSGAEYCPRENLTMPNTITRNGRSYTIKKLGDGIFSSVTLSGVVTLPNYLEIIGNGVFSNNKSAITSVIISEGLTSIGNGAFQYNSLLTGINLPSTLKTIGGGAFFSGGLESIVIPDSVTFIDGGAFQNNTKLKTVKIGTGLETLNSGVFNGCVGIESLDLGNLNTIYAGNFSNTQITELVIPDSITYIGTQAFANNSKLKTVKFGNGLTTLGSNIFEGCTELETVELGDGIETIQTAFPNNIKLKNIVWGNNVKNIYGGAFYNTAIEELEIPDSVTYIGAGAFSNNTNLKTVKFGTGLKSLEPGVFGGSLNIESVDLGELGTIYGGNFSGTQLTGIVIPATVKTIASNAFIDNTKLERVIFTGESQIQSIGAGAFSYSALTGINLPNSLTTLGTGVFCTDDGTNTGTVIGFIGDDPSTSAEDLESQDDTACFVIKNSTYQVDITLTGENMGDFAQDSERSGSKNYGKRIVIKVESRLGYRFWKWELNGEPVWTGEDNDEYWTGDLELVVTSGMYITGFFTGDINTYAVHHRKENLDGEYSGEDMISLTGYGITDELTNAVALDFPGFTGKSFDQKIIAASGDTVIDIYYDRELYTISFDSASGSAVTGITEKYEKEIQKPEDPERAGYEFSGWYYDSGELCEFPIPMPLNGVNLTAQWTANTGTEYKVEYYLQNEDLINYDFHLTGTQQGTTNTKGTAKVITFTGYEFNATHAGNITSGTIAGDGSLVLRLFYDRKSYTVSTGTNDGDMGTVSYEGEARYGKKIKFTAHRDLGYILDRWEVNGDTYYSGSALWTGDELEIELTGDLAVIGHFSAAIYKIIYHDIEEIRPDKVYTGAYKTTTEEALAPTWTKTGYTLSWSGTKPETYPAEDTVIDSVWTANKYTVKFGANEGTGEMLDQEFVYDESQNLRENSYTRVGYTFTGWKNGENVYTDKENVKNLATESGAVVTLEAQWREHKYTVNYEGGEGAQGSMASKEVRYTEEFELPDNNDSFVKTGYTFSGWIYEGNSYATGSLLSGLTAEDNGNVTFTADWKANTDTQFKVEYYLQNVEDEEYTFAETGTQEGITDETGYAYVKDFTGFEFNTTHAGNITSGTIAGDGSLVLKVYYDRNNYEVSVETNDANKGTVEGGGTYRYGKRITLTATHKQGYRFEKWMRGEEVLGTGETLEITVEEAMGVTGYFVASGNTYTVEHWQQNVDDDNYTEITTDRENKEGMTDDDTEAEVRPYEGFTLSGNLSDYQTRILPDGSTVVKLYYNRNNYEVSYVFEGKVPAGQSAPLGNTYRYGETVPAAEARAESGYSFAWDNADSFTMPANNVVITGTWTADTDTKYHVQYRLQNADNDGYTQTGSDVEKTGETDTTAYANTGVEYVGFTFSGNHAENVLTGNIAGDGSLVLKVYYDMKLYSVTTGSNDETQGSVTVDGGSYTYGKRITFSAHPRDALHKFIRWEVNGETVISGGVVWTGDLEVVVTGDVVVTGHFAAYSGCEWNGGIIAHGTSVTGYQAPEVEFGGTCVSEIRTCNDGTLSGSYQYTGCEVAAPLSCELPWGGYAAHEAIVTGYQANSETCPAQCSEIAQVASCYNGEWNVAGFTGTYVESGCTTAPVVIPANYKLDTCPAHGSCSSMTGYTVNENACVLGEEKYKLDSCEAHYHITGDNTQCEIDSFEITWSYKDGAGNETGDTTTVEYGEMPSHASGSDYQTAQTGYTFANWTPELTGATENTGYTAVYNETAREYTVMTGTNDNEQGSVTVETTAPYIYGKRITFSAHPRDALHKFIRWEVNGETVISGGVVWTGDLEVVVTGDVVVTGHFAAYSGCEWNGGIISHGTSVTGYQAPEVEFGGTCVSEIRTCNDGTLSGSYQYTGCEVAAPLSCELPWGGYAAHEAIVTGYQANSETCPAQCSEIAQVASCYNGEWNVAGFTGTYVESGCTTAPVVIPAEYVLDTCSAHGSCSSMTGYTVNENACVLGEEKYKLDSCEEHYHITTDGKSCEADSEEDTGKRRSGGGGHHSRTPRDNQHGSAEDEISNIEIEDIMETIDITEDEKSEYSDEVIDAYKWSYAESITTVLGLTKANPEGYVNRGQLARMVVKYANIIGKETPLDTPTRCYWNDNYRDWESEETKFYAEKACALGIMGIRVDKFSPKKLVSRAEFGTVLSRLLWGDQYDIINPSDNNPYYRKHLEALKREGIMTQIDNPGRRLELMKRIWVMFRRVKSPK